MVKLSLADFAEATNRMVQLSGVKKTRLMVKLRPSDKKIVLKSTDQRATLTTKALEQKDLKIVEQVIGDFVSRCTLRAPAEAVAAASKDDKKASSSKAKKAKGGKK